MNLLHKGALVVWLLTLMQALTFCSSCSAQPAIGSTLSDGWKRPPINTLIAVKQYLTAPSPFPPSFPASMAFLEEMDKQLTAQFTRETDLVTHFHTQLGLRIEPPDSLAAWSPVYGKISRLPMHLSVGQFGFKVWVSWTSPGEKIIRMTDSALPYRLKFSMELPPIGQMKQALAYMKQPVPGRTIYDPKFPKDIPFPNRWLNGFHDGCLTFKIKSGKSLSDAQKELEGALMDYCNKDTDLPPEKANMIDYWHWTEDSEKRVLRCHYDMGHAGDDVHHFLMLRWMKLDWIEEMEWG